jgi:hypothetical protein
MRPLPRRSGKPWPWNAIRGSCPADWGIGMTVCIAAHCFTENCIALTSDTMITTRDTSSDFTSVKTEPVGRTWIAMFAGNDITSVGLIFAEVHRLLHEANDDDTAANVRTAFTIAFQTELRKKSENEILQPLGYSLKEFKEVGLVQLGPEHFSRLVYQIQEQSLDLEFLVAGFDGGNAHIFTVTSPGTIADYTAVGFWAIGVGQTNALGSLFNSQSMFVADMETTIYRLCEAKFNGENAAGVGKKTVLTILASDGNRRSLLREVDDLRAPWEATRALKVPEDGWTKASEIWAKVKKEFEEKRKARQSAALNSLAERVLSSADPKEKSEP